MKSKEKVNVHGRLSVYKDYITSIGIDRVKHYEEDNVVTLLAKQNVLAGIYLSTTSDPVATLQVGTGGGLDQQSLYPKPVNQNLTALYNTYQAIPVTYQIQPTIPSVTFIADLDESSGNGQIINESGLFTASGVMWSIRTYPGITKSSEFSIHYEWVISLS